MSVFAGMMAFFIPFLDPGRRHAGWRHVFYVIEASAATRL
jgi:hypothetical protein